MIDIDFELVETADGIRSAVSDLMNSETPAVGVDTETTDLSARKGKLRLVQLSNGDDKNYVIDVFKLGDQKALRLLNPLLQAQRPRKIFHNAKFDVGWFQEVLETEVEGVFDTYLASRMLDRQMDAKLDAVAFKFADVEVDKTEQKSDWSGNLTDSQYKYAIRDAYWLPKIRTKQIEQLYQDDMIEIAQIEFNAVSPVARMENVGFPLDTEMYAKLIENLIVRRDLRKQELEEVLNTALGISPITTVQNGLFGDAEEITTGGINLNSPKQLLDAFHKLGVNIDSTNKQTISSNVGKYPQLQYLTRYRAEQILVTSFGQKILNLVDASTGRIYATFWQLLTDTARFSCSNPNLQQMPHTTEFRECFRPTDPNRCFVIADYSGIELRILAQLSQDEVMIDAFLRGLDLHSITAKAAFNLPCDVKDVKKLYPEQRVLAKGLNFGIVYGIGAKKYADNTGISPSEAKKAIKGFYNLYKGVTKYLYGIEEEGIANRMVRTLAGRRLNLYFTDGDEMGISMNRRNARNYPIQGACADILKLAIKIVYDNLKPFNADIVNIVHDEIIIECDRQDAEEVKFILERGMLDAAERYLPDVRVEVEGSIGDSWASK